ncbi:RHS repeat-associated core domain-containing protein [Mesorhizobium sp. ZC-5]|uniref:RHS repeat-associated core domain-containing protein n=1 Tax=Mesorhizobium sp. ZC-5 TaxID=2986066 RepID=UPI0021E80783|nr:RHS repeat-associated core domain-containing protein [Mesorhizobium sp. ZC-5]MCV3243118.1 hypothetical protein [Mesorhizobium sp. ZC-5]
MAAGLLRAGVLTLGLFVVGWSLSGQLYAQELNTEPEQSPALPQPAPGYGNSGGGFNEQAPNDPSSTASDDKPAVEEPNVDDGLAEMPAPDAAEAQASAAAAAVSGPIIPDKLEGTIEKPSMPGEMDSTGNLTYDIPIEVPAFRGLEPSIALNFNSSRKTKTGGLYQGWLGYGWGLDGFDVIERASPGYGLPDFDASDIYLLNGAELVPCAQAAAGAPSCAAGVGGTHVTEVESYRRIALTGSGPSSLWKVTDLDGTVSTFKTIAALSGVTPTSGTPAYNLAVNRWLLAAVTDTHGNTVSFAYACPDMAASPLTAVCYPNTISYTGAVITFYREARADVILMANGYDIAATKQRLKTISIRSGGVLRSAYTMTYDQAPFSNASRLMLVELHGLHGDADATVSSAGVVSGAVKKRIASFDYLDTTASYVDAPLDGLLPYTATPPNPVQGSTRVTGGLQTASDLNFDGKDELVATVSPQKWQVIPGGGGGGYWTSNGAASQFHLIFNASGTITKRSPSSLNVPLTGVPFDATYPDGTTSLAGSNRYLGRFDAARVFKDYAISTTTKTVAPEGSNGTPGPTTFRRRNAISKTDADLDGIGYPCATAPAIYSPVCAKLPPEINDASSLGSPVPVFVADMEGDGIDSIYRWVDPRGSSYLTRFLGVGDFEANGRQRMLTSDGTAEPNGSAWKFGMAAPVADCAKPVPFPQSQGTITLHSCALVDINGDGATDVVRYYVSFVQTIDGKRHEPADRRAYVYLSTGNSFKALASGSQGYFTISGPPKFTDYDADGKTDIIFGPENFAAGNTLYQQKVYALQFGASNLLVQYAPLTSMSGDQIHDYNGDGLPDFLRATPNGVQGVEWALKLSAPSSGRPNMLRTIVNELGAIISAYYSPSSYWSNGYMPDVMHPVTKLSVSDGRDQIADTSYTYFGGKYDPKSRKFFGYQKIVETKPLANGETAAPTVETTYRQDVASYGLPELTVFKDGAGVVRKQVDETWSVNAASKPYWSKNTKTDTRLTEQVTLPLRVERAFDQWGNLYDEKDHGRTDLSGDERRTYRFYIPNTTAFITSLPRSEAIFNTFDSGADAVRSDYFYYDGAVTYLASPIKGNVTKIQHVNSSQVDVFEKFTYDDDGNQLTAIDGANNVTATNYDPTYNLYPTLVRSPRYFANGSLPADVRHKTTALYNPACGLPSERIDLNLVRHTYTYDPFCRLAEYKNMTTGNYRKITYYNEGNPASQSRYVNEPLPNSGIEASTAIYYDGLGRIWREFARGDVASVNPVRLIETQYDLRGNVAKKSHPYFYPPDPTKSPQFTTTTYDWADRPLRVVNPDGSDREYDYFLYPAMLPNIANVPLNAVYLVDELGRGTYSYFNSWGDLIRTTWMMADGSEQVELHTYDQFHQLIRVRDNGGAAWAYAYDMLGNRLYASDPDLGLWTYKYDLANRLIEQQDARGRVTMMSYDQLGRLLKRWVVSTGEVLAENTYDEPRSTFANIGQLTTTKNAAVTHIIDYHPSGAVTHREVEIDGVVSGFAYFFDDGHKPIWQRYGPAPYVDIGSSNAKWTYTANGQLDSIPGYITSTEYEADGQTRKITYANGVTTEFYYSPTRRWLTAIATKSGNGSVLFNTVYTRDAAGRITAINGAAAVDDWTYTYNHRDWLLSANNAGNNALDEVFSYSANGNLLSRDRLTDFGKGDFTYPAMTSAKPVGGLPGPHAPTKLGAATFVYDSNGNLTSDPSYTPGTRTFTWDAANRLSRVNIGSADTSFFYGPDGARVKKAHSLGAVTLYPSADIEIDATGGAAAIGPNDITRYPHPDIRVVGTQKFWLHRDHLASVRLVTNESGAATEKAIYAAYGERLKTDGLAEADAIARKKGYIGERYDPETGLQYLNARYMDPHFGRFISPDDWDPALPGVGTNRYAYALDDPSTRAIQTGMHGRKPLCRRMHATN